MPSRIAVAYPLKTCGPINLIPMREITIANSSPSNKFKALGDEGYVKVGNFAASKNKFGYACLLAPAGVVEKSRLTAASIASKLDENNAPHDEINALVEC